MKISMKISMKEWISSSIKLSLQGKKISLTMEILIIKFIVIWSRKVNISKNFSRKINWILRIQILSFKIIILISRLVSQNSSCILCQIILRSNCSKMMIYRKLGIRISIMTRIFSSLSKGCYYKDMWLGRKLNRGIRKIYLPNKWEKCRYLSISTKWGIR